MVSRIFTAHGKVVIWTTKQNIRDKDVEKGRYFPYTPSRDFFTVKMERLGVMVKISLPDGSTRRFKGSVSGADIASDISTNLLRHSVAMVVDDVLCDLSHEIHDDCKVEIITYQSKQGLEIVRHDCAHIMAQAVQELFPETQLAFGPITETGFYYDFYSKDTISEKDFDRIEKKMAEIISRNEPFIRHTWSLQKAHTYFVQKGETFKAEHVLTLPKEDAISVYTQGKWLDLCRGVHGPSTGKFTMAFKLVKVAGAYWRGDSTKQQLQRIYATCWHTNKELKAYLHAVEEAKARDHRKIGRELDLFHIQDEAVGNIFWHQKGLAIYRCIEQYMRRQLQQQDYVEVKTPQILDRTLWEHSGHWEKFREEMFILEDKDKKVLALKPMNCPAHVEIFKRQNVSYKSLPLRMWEFGCCHRNEPSGALHGTMRVRAFTQDDAHIFCMEDQIVSETKKFYALLKTVYQDFGFKDVHVKFSDRPKVRAGSDETWDKAEKALKEATVAAGVEWTINAGEGAFYGPKLEFILIDAIGRSWQCGTLQVDFILPERLNATYIGHDNVAHFPVILHRAVLGSFERFIGILIENYSGRFPLWLAPVQVVICPIVDTVIPFAEKVKRLLETKNIRVELDSRNEKITYKIRHHSMQKVPVQFIVGVREMENETVAIRRLGTQKQEILDLHVAIAKLVEQSTAPDLAGL